MAIRRTLPHLGVSARLMSVRQCCAIRSGLLQRRPWPKNAPASSASHGRQPPPSRYWLRAAFTCAARAFLGRPERSGDADDYVGEIRQVRLADGTKLTLDTATSVEVEVGRSLRRAVIKTGRLGLTWRRLMHPL